MSLPPEVSNEYLRAFLLHFADSSNHQLDIDGSIHSLKQARVRLGSFITTAGSAEHLVVLMGVEGRDSNERLSRLLEMIRSYRATADAATDPQRRTYWELKAELTMMIHGYYRDSIYP